MVLAAAGEGAEPVSSAGEAVSAASAALAAAGCETPRLDAELLIADAIGVDRAALHAHPELPVGARAARVAMERIRRRGMREPVAYILGRRAFRHIELAVDARVLIPRPETELLVEVAADLAAAGARVHDVGTGSGAVALALRHERPDLAVSASDASDAAVAVASANAARLGLELDLCVAAGLPVEVAPRVDLVVANLPYVRDDEWRWLEPEIVRYEPRAALAGGEDGLDPIRALIAAAPAGVAMALEHAPAQAEAVRELLDDAETRADLAGRPRVTHGRVR